MRFYRVVAELYSSVNFGLWLQQQYKKAVDLAGDEDVFQTLSDAIGSSSKRFRANSTRPTRWNTRSMCPPSIPLGWVERRRWKWDQVHGCRNRNTTLLHVSNIQPSLNH